MSGKYFHPETDFLRKFDLPAPASYVHGTEDDVRAKMTQLKPNSWRLEGNKLIGMTDMGPLVQTIPTDYICKGTDKRGLPILEKVVL